MAHFKSQVLDLEFPMSAILKHSRVVRIAVSRNARSLATPAASRPSTSNRSNFTETLTEGPSLDDFISGDVSERVVLGNTNTYEALFISGHNTA